MRQSCRHMIRFFIFLFLSLILTDAQSGKLPRPIGSESRIRLINYTPNTVFEFIGHYEYQTILEFGLDEEIETISMGTPTPWQVLPAGNRLFIKPIDDDATTNMTVITDKRMYFFEMHAKEATGLYDENLSFVIKFIYPEQYQQNAVKQVQTNSGPDLSKPELYNFNYTISGEARQIEPLQIFDDGEFTYLKFKDINAELPAIFLVDSENKEGLVNFRIEGGYMVVERVVPKFTLRHGGEVICVFNENEVPSKKKSSKKSGLSIF